MRPGFRSFHLKPARGLALGSKKFAPQDGRIRARREGGTNPRGLKFRKGGPVAGLQQQKPRRRWQCEQRRGFSILLSTPEMWQ